MGSYFILHRDSEHLTSINSKVALTLNIDIHSTSNFAINLLIQPWNVDLEPRGYKDAYLEVRGIHAPI